MMRSTDDAIERAKVREVAAIFHSHEAIEAAAEALLLAGFDRADIDRLADLDSSSGFASDRQIVKKRRSKFCTNTAG
jgi:hypothetical protein